MIPKLNVSVAQILYSAEDFHKKTVRNIGGTPTCFSRKPCGRGFLFSEPPGVWGRPLWCVGHAMGPTYIRVRYAGHDGLPEI